MKASFMEPGDEPTPQQLEEMQKALEAVANDPAYRHRVIVLPPTPPQVELRIHGTQAMLVCPCGWEWEVHSGYGMTGYNLEFLRSLARHTCLEGPVPA